MAQAIERLYKLTVQNQSAVGQLKKMNTGLGGIQKNLRSIGGLAKTAFAAFGVGISASFLKGVIATNSALAKQADAVGINIETFQEYTFAAGRAGVSSTQLASNLTAFVKRVGEAKNGMGPLVSGLKNMNTELLKSVQQSSNQEEAFRQIADAIKDAESATEAAAIANAAFGRSGITMVNMLRNGSEGLDEMAKKARDLGVIMQEDLVRNAEDYDDQIADITLRFKNTFGNVFLKTIANVSNNWVKAFATVEASVLKAYAAMKLGAKVMWEAIKAAFKNGVAAALIPVKALVETAALLSDRFRGVADKIPAVGDSYKDMAKNVAAAKAEFDETIIAIDDQAVAIFQIVDAENQAKEAYRQSAREARRLQREASAMFQGLTDDASGANDELSKTEQYIKNFVDAAKQIDFEDTMQPEVIQALNDAFIAGEISIKAYEAQLKKIVEAEEEAEEKSTSLAVAIGQTLHDSVDGLAGAIIDFSKGGKDAFKNFAQSVIDDITKMIIKMQILEAFKNSSFTFAKGGAVDGVQAFANGGVVTRPTAFRLANGSPALMGESGPEAIMPLSRGRSGNLGIEAQVKVNVINNAAGTEVLTSENQAGEIDIIIQRVAERIRRGGNNISRAFETTYGMSRARGAN